MASSAPFVFGTFSLYEGRDAYSLVSVEVQNYFREITENMEAACYGSYFLEFADYYGRENLEAVETLKLLYQSLQALLKSARSRTGLCGLSLIKAPAEINGVHGKASGKAGRLHDLYVGIRSRVAGGKALYLSDHRESPGRIYKVRSGK